MYNFVMRTTLLLVSIFAATAGFAATLEQYLSAPFASEMHAAPGGGKVVWLLNERGARNLWVAAAPDYKGRRLTSFKDDDGQDIGMIQWTADGKSIVYVRGGDLEHIGRDNPNPRSLSANAPIRRFTSFHSTAARRRKSRTDVRRRFLETATSLMCVITRFS